MENLIVFVKQLSDEGAVKMENEKITPELVNLMTDTELKEYIPKHGDRLRLRKHLKERNPAFDRRNKLFEKLRKKLDRRNNENQSSDDETMPRTGKLYGNKNALKDTRTIELGWIHRTYKRAKQVRSRTGGGTRKIQLNKHATKVEIMQEALELFFKNGDSSKGNINEFETDIWDFSEKPLKEGTTIQEVIDESRMASATIRFYLATWEKPVLTPSNDILSDALSSAGISTTDTTFAEPLQSEYSPDLQNLEPTLDIDFILDSAASAPEPATVDMTEEINITVHRGHVLMDMILAFKTVNLKNNTVIEFSMVLPNGSVEVAEDSGGVTRDTLTEFWGEFYENCTLGTNEKVPFLRHDFGDLEWQSVAKIIVFGWRKEGYFPIALSKPFVMQCLFGQSIGADLLEAFFNFLPEVESKCLKCALDDFPSVDGDEVIEYLDAHEVRRLPTESNIRQLLTEVAHKELIQTPMFVADCWADILSGMLTKEQLVDVYGKLNPTARAVCKVLKFSDTMTPEETVVANHLKRFIKELRPENLGKFVRFCTGSNLLLAKEIKIEFVGVTGLARRPVAHTCNNLLEISRTYDSFPDFRSDFTNVLESNVWVMDII